MGQSFSFISLLLLDQVGPYLLTSGFCSVELVDLELKQLECVSPTWETLSAQGGLFPVCFSSLTGRIDLVLVINHMGPSPL